MKTIGNIIGQVFVYECNKEAIKILSKETVKHERGDYIVYYCAEWDVDKFVNNQKRVTDESLEKYYKLIEGDFEKTYKQSIGIINGTELMPALKSVEFNENTAVMGAVNKFALQKMADELEVTKRQFEELQLVMSVEMERRKRELDIIRRNMEVQLGIMRTKIKQVNRIIDTIELYLGVYENIVQIQEGAGASKDDPICFRQMVLYVDEEIALTKFNADFTDIELFDKWLTENERYKDFAPENKCVVAFKPRRSEKKYSSDAFHNWQMNIPNFESYLLIRNGENIYRICSSLTIHKRLFPLRSELPKIFETIKSSWQSDREKADEELHTYKRLGFALQGLIDRTDVFGEIEKGINIFDLDKWEKQVNFIYDDEATLPTGRMSFKEWKDGINETIQEGSRVIYVNSPNGYEEARFYKYYNGKYSAPSSPKDGLYDVFMYKSEFPDHPENGSLYIKYLPKGGWYGHERKNMVWFKIEKYDDILNFDQVDINDIDFYLNNRVDRKNYLKMLPVLIELKDTLIEHQKWEDHFIELLNSRINKGDNRQLIRDCIRWWKVDKVKWKRAITKDDAKALRMIELRVKKYLTKYQ